MDEHNNDKFEFVTETIKRRPINYRKVAKKIAFTVFLAILFGAVSSVTFLFLYPKLSKKVYPQEEATKPVTLPVEQEDLGDLPEEEFIPPEGDDPEQEVASVDVKEDEQQEGTESSGSESENAGEDAEAEQKKENTEPDNVGEAENSEETPSEDEKDEKQGEVVINQVVETIEKNLELDDYRMLLRKISAIATSTQKSLVTVSGKSEDTDWFNNTFESDNSSTGIIVADNGKELLIIAPSEIFHGATNVSVTFVNGDTYPASIKRSDGNTGLTVVAVDLNIIDEHTSRIIEKAQFGSINAASVGTPVVAVGSPYGVAESMGMGQIISNSYIIDKVDTNMRIISTDIYGSSNASGVIVNYNGRIIGIICHEQTHSDMTNLIRAYSVMDISETIEKISNGQKLSKIGIYGVDVTKEANNDYGVPMGAYVKEVVVDSPAMSVGIRNGDVIVKMGTVDITSFEDYKKELLKCQPGDVVNITLQRPGGDNYTEITYEVTLEEL